MQASKGVVIVSNLQSGWEAIVQSETPRPKGDEYLGSFRVKLDQMPFLPRRLDLRVVFGSPFGRS